MVMVVMVVGVVMVWEGPTVVSMVMVWVGEGWRVVTMVTMVVTVVTMVNQVLTFVVHDVCLVPQVSRSTKVTVLGLLHVCMGKTGRGSIKLNDDRGREKER